MSPANDCNCGTEDVGSARYRRSHLKWCATKHVQPAASETGRIAAEGQRLVGGRVRGSWKRAAEEWHANYLVENELRQTAEAALAALDLRLQAASEFIRDVIEAVGRPQPALDGIVDLPELAMQVVGQIEEYKVLAREQTALRAVVEEAVQVARNYHMLFHDDQWADRLKRWEAALTGQESPRT